MSTVASIDTYCKIRGIQEDVSLIASGSPDWDLVESYVPNASDYGSALVYITDADVALIWGIETRTPWNDAYTELAYSAAALHRKIARRKHTRKSLGL